MKKLTIRVIGYILLRFFIFLVIISAIDKNVQFINSSDLRNGEDWFMFLWLFIMPGLIDAVVLTFPFSYCLNKIEISDRRLGYYFIFIGLFSIEYAIAHWMIGLNHSLLKAELSALLFILIFRKQLNLTIKL